MSRRSPPSTPSPATLPETMAAWVIREERFGEPKDAFQLEEIEVPEPGAFEVIVRVMAAGVNYNNVWAALGKPVSVMKYGDHPEFGHHIGGSDASGVVWKVGDGVTRWKAGDEVVIHCNQASYEDPEVHGLDPMAAPVAADLGLRDDLGLLRAVHQGPGPAAAAQAAAPDLGGGRLLRPRLLHRLPHADDPLQAAGRAEGPDLGRRRRPRRLRHADLQGRGRASASASSPPTRRASSSSSSAPSGYINRNEFAGMMRKGGETPEEEKARFKESRALRQGASPRSSATRPTSSSSTSARPRSRPRC